MTLTLSLILFALVVWAVAWRVRSARLRQSMLLGTSYLVYSSWGVSFLFVLIISTIMNYVCGLALRREQTVQRLWMGISLNILLLGFFKYLPAFLGGAVGGTWQGDFVRHIVMPVGISFWTFQALSYLCDLYLGKELDPTLLEFGLYMAFWPTVVSGPVCRLSAMLPQFRRRPILSTSNVSAGALLVVQGLFMKMVLAQLLGSGWTPGGGVSFGFDQVSGGWGAVDVWLLGVGFGFQLFFDFAGYSLMVIGVARMFGITVAENFNRPFLSVSPSVFWTRWHMSLSFWIRDYVFTPLATVGRRYSWWPYVVFVISMTLFGLWHGPKWTFIAFGFYHGVLLVLHRLGQQLTRWFSIKVPQALAVLLSWGVTFGLLSIGFILFRANDLPEAVSMIGALFSPAAYGHSVMPRSFRVLTTVVALGYFGFAGIGSLLTRLRTRYFEFGTVVEFFSARLWWWLGPAVSLLVLLAGASVVAHKTVIAVRPFMYTVF